MEEGKKTEQQQQPHAVCIPFPAQGHITPMMNMAKILHHKGFFITFVNTEFNHRRLLKSLGSEALLSSHPNFRFETIPDCLPSSSSSSSSSSDSASSSSLEADSTQDIPSLCLSTSTKCLPHFVKLLHRLSSTPSLPPVSSIVSDGVMSFTLSAALDLSLPVVLFWTCSAYGALCYTHFSSLLDKRIIPLQDSKSLVDGYLEREIDWIPGIESIRLRDMPTFLRTTDAEDVMLKFILSETSRIPKATAVILNTYDSLEGEALKGLQQLNPRVYSIGPLQLQVEQLGVDASFNSLKPSLWREEEGCLEWLENRGEKSVVYVNFGSITVMTREQLCEFAWGLANSGVRFLWIVRRDVVKGGGGEVVLPEGFVEETRERGMIASWCDQERVLRHKAVGGFLTHSGWNSTVEGLVGGVGMVCWPFFAEQQTNCYFSRRKWGVGMEIDEDVKRGEVEVLVRELMCGEEGRRLRDRAVEWGRLAASAVAPAGSSALNLDTLVTQLLLSRN